MNRASLFWKVSVFLGFSALLLVGILLGAWLRRIQPRVPPPALIVRFLPVGEGDAVLIQMPDGRAALLDTGPASAAPILRQALRDADVHVLDVLILAGPREKNLGGVPALLQSGVTVREVWDGTGRAAGQARRAALEAIRRRHIPSRTARAGQTWETVSVLWPPEDSNPDAGSADDALVCRIKQGNTTLLLAGAADAGTEARLLSGAGEQLDGDILFVPDGGAEATATAELLKRAGPTVAVLSSGPNRPPSPGALHRLQAAGVALWRTDMQGTVSVRVDGRTPPVVVAARS